MNLEIKFQLTDPDLEYFRAKFQEARAKFETMDPRKLVESAHALVDSGLASKPPDFVCSRLGSLRRIIKMVEDDTWQIPADERTRVTKILAYFVDPDDIIDDEVPVLGLIDDAIAIELAVRELQHEIEAYEEFSAYRSAEAQRRVNRGQSGDISKEDWLADRRAALHSRMRERRTQEASGWRYTTF